MVYERRTLKLTMVRVAVEKEIQRLREMKR